MCVPTERQSSARHVGLARIGKKTKLSRPRATESTTIDPDIHFLVAGETPVQFGGFANAH